MLVVVEVLGHDRGAPRLAAQVSPKTIEERVRLLRGLRVHRVDEALERGGELLRRLPVRIGHAAQRTPLSRAVRLSLLNARSAFSCTPRAKARDVRRH